MPMLLSEAEGNTEHGVIHQSCSDPARSEIRIEIPHRRTTLTVYWPAADAEGCARFMRELLQ
ncbi:MULTISPECIES: hypothetical protein [Pseudomonas]|uniref:hypothetical protein n=1 Tax=Pseudomonas TaxID=286 RepID=UPI0003E47AA6|nr:MULTISPECIES: hypothetical protein [Pseudomonas]MBB1605415.1 hypothetical protein [Pseudomonas sp. UMC76]MBB1641360.1 hypothetical protein [Pseudomonas sp. UME83]NTX89393.1 hypothetical protein [Pseudomonas sp. UMA643]NTY19300.1 hypothetical protein [Pseudomonas sp. UMC3103]NTY24216.1 hypothetical protein [Pseudomonas sp. UMA603]